MDCSFPRVLRQRMLSKALSVRTKRLSSMTSFFQYGFPSALIGCTFDLGIQKELNHERELCGPGESSRKQSPFICPGS